MSQRTYVACHQAVSSQHTNPPNSFLDQLIDAINPLPNDVFDRNDRHDIYSVMLGSLGPYRDLLHRKAVMCEVLRVQAAFESDWKWNEGVDRNNDHSMHHKEGEETGAFQVSWDSLRFDDDDQSLHGCLDRLAGGHDVMTFIEKMKSNHALAVEYCARLLRFNTAWCGTINDAQKVIAHVRRDAVAEFETFLRVGNPVDNPASGNESRPILQTDREKIGRLLDITSSEATLDDAQARAARLLLNYDGEIYPHDGCAITQAVLLRDAGIEVPLIYQALELCRHLENRRGWQVIELGEQKPGDIGSTCGTQPNHGADHMYLLLKQMNNDEMLVADNQSPHPHFRFISGQGGKTPTKYFLRAV